MVDMMSAAELRRWAMRCFADANDARCSGDERERLLKMYSSLLALASSADWLAGRNNLQDCLEQTSGATEKSA